MERAVPLESAALAVCNASSVPPLIFQLPPAKGREVLNEIQNAPVRLCPACVTSCRYHTGAWGEVEVYLIAPEDEQPVRNVIFYIHGAGWVFGNYHTHEKLVRELAARTHSLVVFPEYSLAPEARYPVAIEQCYRILCSLRELTGEKYPDLDWDTLTVAGDSAGGNMAIAMTLMAKFRNGPNIQKQLLYYPVTNAFFNTNSYRQFAVGYYLYRAGMQWFWNQYAPSARARNQITASPLRAGIDCLRGLPEAMVINGQADVLRDEGEAYAEKLRRAGVEVTAIRVQGTIHDFVMLNALDQTNACRTAMDASTAWINRKNQREDCCAEVQPDHAASCD